jgi:hypothetical protein
MARRPPGSRTEALSPGDATSILALRLLVARAANKDSLVWWDDDSLTSHASFLLERLFPMAPALAARNLALEAALARHQAACPVCDGAVHLYRLEADNSDQLAVRGIPLLTVPVPDDPISSTDALRLNLLAMLGKPVAYRVVRHTETQGLQIETPPSPAGIPALLHRARALAWAYLEGKPSQPVFPFVVE